MQKGNEEAVKKLLGGVKGASEMAEKKPKCPNGHSGHMIPVQKQPHEVPFTPQPGWVCAVCGAIVMRCVCGRPLYRDPSTRAVEDCRNRDCVLAKKTLPKARKKKPSALKRPRRR